MIAILGVVDRTEVIRARGFSDRRILSQRQCIEYKYSELDANRHMPRPQPHWTHQAQRCSEAAPMRISFSHIPDLEIERE